MRHIDFDDLWKDHLFDYKDGDLLVIDDITRLNLSDYENTKLAFVMAVFCVEGRMQVVVEGQEYRIGGGDFFVYMPGQVIGEILLSQHADVKVIAFAQRAIDRSLYLHKFVWQNLEYVKDLLDIADSTGKDYDELLLEQHENICWLHFAVRPHGQQNRRKISFLRP